MNQYIGRREDLSTLDAQDRRRGTSSPQLRMVVVVADAEAARMYELHEGAERTIGRAPEADIAWADPSLSRAHARLRRAGTSVHLSDLGSRNGSWVGGRQVERAELRVGDVAVLGSVTISLQLRPSCEPALLGVSSAAGVLQYLEQECARCTLLQHPLTVMMMRALRAELALPELVARCASVICPIDRIGLYDREVLIAVLPETDSATAAHRAQRMSAARAGVACGIASLHESGFTPEQLVSAAGQALRAATATRPYQLAPPVQRTRHVDAGPLVRRSAAMLDLQRLVERLAPKRIAVLVLGETGTGKELIARELHERSGRRGPLTVVNCAAIPEQLIESALFGHVKGAFTGADRDQPGVFVQAHRGTIFLDEVGELSPAAQAALLRTLDTQRVCAVGAQHEATVDVRVVAATHRDLAAMTERGAFRLDLFHRLNAMTLHVPPLRERADEIEPLIDAFLIELSSPPTPPPRFSREALARLCAYAWPGNVRELRNVVERALAISDGAEIGLQDLPRHVATDSPASERPELPPPVVQVSQLNRPSPVQAARADAVDLRANMQRFEAELIGEALRRTHGNQRRAASMLRVPLRTLERKLQALGSRVPRPR